MYQYRLYQCKYQKRSTSQETRNRIQGLGHLLLKSEHYDCSAGKQETVSIRLPFQLHSIAGGLVQTIRHIILSCATSSRYSSLGINKAVCSSFREDKLLFSNATSSKIAITATTTNKSSTVQICTSLCSTPFPFPIFQQYNCSVRSVLVCVLPILRFLFHFISFIQAVPAALGSYTAYIYKYRRSYFLFLGNKPFWLYLCFVFCIIIRPLLRGAQRAIRLL